MLGLRGADAAPQFKNKRRPMLRNKRVSARPGEAQRQT